MQIDDVQLVLADVRRGDRLARIEQQVAQIVVAMVDAMVVQRAQ